MDNAAAAELGMAEDFMGAGAIRALIQRRCRELGISMQLLAERAELTRPYLYKLINGTTRDPSVHTLFRLARALQVAPITLLRHYIGLQASGRNDLPTSLIRGRTHVDDAVAFTADVTVPDHMLVAPGERFTKVWSIQNVGTSSWTGRRLVRVEEELVVARRVGHRLEPMLNAHLHSIGNSMDVPETHPGQYVELSMDFVAPRENCSVASLWRMRDNNGPFSFPQQFFLQVIVTVVGT